jgi:hypothetical protein
VHLVTPEGGGDDDPVIKKLLQLDSTLPADE